jgi:RNA polymerase sigma-70 factor, ECF subfamily
MTVKQQLPIASGNRGSERQEYQDGLSPLVAHRRVAYNLARWLVRDETEAEHVVQNAYLRAITHFSGFRGGDARAWLLTIVRNSCYDRLKQRAACGRCTDFDEAVHSDSRQTPNPETALLMAERTEIVRRSLEELPPQYREVLVLREMEQRSYREIAEMSGSPSGTVMSRLSRARHQLGQILSTYMESGQCHNAASTRS